MHDDDLDHMWDGADESDLPRRYPAPTRPPVQYGVVRPVEPGSTELALLDENGVRLVRLIPTPDGSGWMQAATSKGA